MNSNETARLRALLNKAEPILGHLPWWNPEPGVVARADVEIGRFDNPDDAVICAAMGSALDAMLTEVEANNDTD